MEHVMPNPDIAVRQSYITDADGGVSYELYERNYDNKNQPLVVYLGLGSTAINQIGQAYLDEYAKVINRPIMNINSDVPPGIDTMTKLAQSHQRSLVSHGIDTASIAGSSWGGLMAARVAVEYGDKVDALVTVSTIDLDSGYGQYIGGLPRHFYHGVKEYMRLYRLGEADGMIGRDSSDFFNPTRLVGTMRIAQLALGESFGEIIAELPGRVQWTNIVGARDAFCNIQQHLNIANERNTIHPFSSYPIVLQDMTHMWASQRGRLAELVNDAIRKDT